MITGLKTLSSKLPCEPAKPTAAVAPCTCAQTMVMASHCVGIHFAGHDGGAGFVLRNNQFAQAATRAGSQPANVVGDLHQRCGQGFQRALGKDEFVVRGKSREFVGMRAEGKSGKFGDFLRGAFGEFRMRVQAGAYGGAADGEIVKPVEDLLQPLDVAIEQTGPAAEFLADGQRDGVLQVGAANLDDVFEFFGLGVNSVAHSS